MVCKAGLPVAIAMARNSPYRRLQNLPELLAGVRVTWIVAARHCIW
jgi:hypothetical protein